MDPSYSYASSSSSHLPFTAFDSSASSSSSAQPPSATGAAPSRASLDAAAPARPTPAQWGPLHSMTGVPTGLMRLPDDAMDRFGEDGQGQAAATDGESASLPLPLPNPGPLVADATAELVHAVQQASREDLSAAAALQGAAGANGEKKGAARKKRAGGGEGEVRLDKEGNPKKKRKQLVECQKKHISCTDDYVKNKPKVVRGGKLISQAKALYGEGLNQSPTPPVSTALPIPPPPPEQVEEIRRASSGSVGYGQAPTILPAEGRLMSTHINQDISDHLIQLYFRVLHQQCPQVDKDLFMRAYEAADRRIENLGPGNECLAMAMQAWASRWSDHPLIIGGSAPTLEDLRKPHGRDFSVLGNRRDEFVRAMQDRALRMVDQRGVLRTSSAAGTTCLSLLEMLLTFDQPHRLPTTGSYLLSAALEHLRNLQLGICEEPGEQCMPPDRLSNGTLLWVVITRDGLSAMFGGRAGASTDDDLPLLCDLFVNPYFADVESFVTSPEPQVLSGIAVASIFRFGIHSVRHTITKLTGPLARSRPVDEAAVRELWAEIDQLAHFAALFRRTVDSVTFDPATAPRTDVWFRDLASLKACHTLAIHLALGKRLEQQEALAAESGKDEAGALDMLRRLRGESQTRAFAAAREAVAMMRGYGAELMFKAAFSTENTAYSLELLLEMPAWEQGGGMENWTWANKVDEVSALLDALKLIGWAWPGYDVLIERTRAVLAEQGAQFQNFPAQYPSVHQPGYLPPAYPPAPPPALPPHAWQYGAPPPPPPAGLYPIDTSMPHPPEPNSAPPVSPYGPAPMPPPEGYPTFPTSHHPPAPSYSYSQPPADPAQQGAMHPPLPPHPVDPHAALVAETYRPSSRARAFNGGS
ncbi:hypothetical protein JCM10207_004468 [Rhodosporidiobolus poonsookiae]